MASNKFVTAPIAWFCNACGVIGLENGLCSGERGITHSPHERMPYYRACDVEPLVEAAQAWLDQRRAHEQQGTSLLPARLPGDPTDQLILALQLFLPATQQDQPEVAIEQGGDHDSGVSADGKARPSRGARGAGEHSLVSADSGAGVANPGLEDCKRCGGTGELIGESGGKWICPDCGATGAQRSAPANVLTADEAGLVIRCLPYLLGDDAEQARALSHRLNAFIDSTQQSTTGKEER